ncbi:uncharacterized protein LOC105392122 [Plutella xylostella]|uniref:uncharacterized protein LOC105392122 n=1 Tax=Plutella xylostella TaxID=51655 RepID=UPI002032ECE9|nr:uncharacterized protein LOC105392122 [Plutella xylostella]
MNVLRTLSHHAARRPGALLWFSPRRFECKKKKTEECRNPITPCDVAFMEPDKKTCFDMRNVTLERASQHHGRMISSFLNNQHWPREPTVTSLYLPPDSRYLQVLSEKYAYSGDRLIALEKNDRTDERRLIGVAVANKIFPWMANELEEWGHSTTDKAERHRMFFQAHCYRHPNLFKKYKVDYIWDIEVLCTASDVSGHGVCSVLLRHMLEEGVDARHPLAQVTATSTYLAAACEHSGMKKEWSMNYQDFVDSAGQRAFYPRKPHTSVNIYVQKFKPKAFYCT